jgi:hypothetical protein
VTATVDPYLGQLADRLAAGGVRWAVIRGETDRPTADDLDLLVHPEDASAFRSIARELGFPRLPAWGHGEHAFHVGRGTGGWWRLDLLTTFRFIRGERLGDDLVPAVLARRTAGRVPRLSPEDTAWALVLHLLLDKDSVSSQNQERLSAAADAGAAGPLAEALAAALPRGWTPERARAALASPTEDAARLAALRRAVSRRLRPGGRPTWLAWRAWRARDTIAARLRKPLTALYRRGPSVALLGPDGAGKSHLVHELPNAFPLGVRTFYLGLYPAGSEHHRGPKGLGFVLRLGGMWRRYAGARAQQLRGRLALFDRHPFDARLTPRQRPRRVDRIRRAVLGHALPAPDLLLILDAPGDVLFARKPEHPADVLEAEMIRYRELAGRLSRAELVDATRSPEEVLDDVVARIWRVWGRRLDGGR